MVPEPYAWLLRLTDGQEYSVPYFCAYDMDPFTVVLRGGSYWDGDEFFPTRAASAV